MKNCPQSYPKYNELSGLEKGCLWAVCARKKIEDILNHLSLPGRIASLVLRRISDELIWQIDNRTGFIDKVENWEFMEGLQKHKDQNDLTDNDVVLYLGSSNDTSVRKIFPQALHFDQSKPKRMPDDFKFIQADYQNLPVSASSVDLAIFKCSFYGNTEIAAKEMNRILKQNGKLMISGNICNYDYSKPPKDLKEAGDQNRILRILESIRKNGFKISKFYSDETALFERGEMDADQIKLHSEAYDRNKRYFYDYIQSVPFEEAIRGRAIHHCQFILGIDWNKRFPADSFRELERIKTEAPEEAFIRIKFFLKKMLNEVIRINRKLKDMESVRNAEEKLKMLEAV